MGVFNSVYMECPHCGKEQEEQFKPGSMLCYHFPDDIDVMPVDLLRSFVDRTWECWSCGKEFRTDVVIPDVEPSDAKIEKI